MNRRTFLAWTAAVLAATPEFAAAASDPGWRAGVPMPVKRSEFGAALLNGSVIVAGEFEAGVQVDAFDLGAGEWRRRAGPGLPTTLASRRSAARSTWRAATT